LFLAIKAIVKKSIKHPPDWLSPVSGEYQDAVGSETFGEKVQKLRPAIAIEVGE
jgi:hypothetical protein